MQHYFVNVTETISGYEFTSEFTVVYNKLKSRGDAEKYLIALINIYRGEVEDMQLDADNMTVTGVYNGEIDIEINLREISKDAHAMMRNARAVLIDEACRVAT